jgi:acetyltransferase-like isoleucine patch superfamily enzyme
MADQQVFPWVRLGRDVDIGLYVIIGQPFRGMKEDEGLTEIGDQAVIRSHTVVYAGTRVGAGFQTGHGVLVREKCTIGVNVSIGSSCVVEHLVIIEDDVRVHSQAFLPEYSRLERGCWIGPNVVLTNAKYPQSPNVKSELRGPWICSGAKIGANATILPGLKVGRNALVGAGSVVTQNVPAGAVVAGNPARIIKSISELPYGS